MLRAALIAACAAGAAADPHEDALKAAWEAQTKGDYQAAHAQLLEASKSDKPKLKGIALHAIGSLHQDGQGFPQNTAKAMEWWQRAAEAGDPKSQTNVGMAYVQGTAGYPQHSGAAAVWFRRAAEQNDVLGQYNLGIMLAEGNGIPRDERGSFRWLKAAADLDHLGAQTALGERLRKTSRKQAQKQGLKWLRRAAEREHPPACTRLGATYLEGGKGVSVDEEMAADWLQKAAELGDAEGQFKLAGMYASDTGVEHDDALAAKWFRAAAEQGHGMAAHNLANFVFRGVGSTLKSGSTEQRREKDRAEAVEWWRKAASVGVVDADFLLGLMYKRGEGGVKRSEKKAVEHWAHAAQHGHQNALRDLIGLADRGVLPAMEALVGLYTNGAPGISPDSERVAHWSGKAEAAKAKKKR